LVGLTAVSERREGLPETWQSVSLNQEPDDPSRRTAAVCASAGRHVALMAEARVFYFREFELRPPPSRGLTC
jgi:hypothetical protein